MSCSDLHESLDRAAEVAVLEADAGEWGPVLAVAVVHAEGVRLVAYEAELASVSPDRIAADVAALGDLLLAGRRRRLS